MSTVQVGAQGVGFETRWTFQQQPGLGATDRIFLALELQAERPREGPGGWNLPSGINCHGCPQDAGTRDLGAGPAIDSSLSPFNK